MLTEEQIPLWFTDENSTQSSSSETIQFRKWKMIALIAVERKRKGGERERKKKNINTQKTIMRNRFTFSQVVNKNRNPCRGIFKQRPKFYRCLLFKREFYFRRVSCFLERLCSKYRLSHVCALNR